MMTKSFTLDKPKRSEGWAKFQEWNRNWNRILASIFCILCFILLFAIVIVNIIETKEIQMEKSTNPTVVLQDLNEDDDDTIPSIIALEEENYVVKMYGKSAVSRICTMTNCTAKCDNGVLESVNTDIELAMGDASHCTEIDIELTNYNSANRTVYKDWYTLSYPVNVVKIENSEFHVIDDFAFSGEQFKQTHSVVMAQLSSLKYLTKNVFVGLDSVISVRFDGFPKIGYIEIGVLHPVRTHIGAFSMHSMPSHILVGNLTGNQQLASPIVSLEYNNFGDTIEKDTFAGLKAVVSLYLRGAGITTLPSGVFDELSLLEIVHIAGNRLTTVPIGIFDVVVPLRVYLSNNTFDCICNEGILYLQKFIQTYEENIVEAIRCLTPAALSYQLIETVDIDCPDDTSTTMWNTNTPDNHSKNTKDGTDTTFSIPINTTTPSTTTDSNESTEGLNDIYLNCEDHSNILNANYVKPITVQGGSVEFKIIKDSNFEIFVEFIDRYYSDITLLWFTNRTTTDTIAPADLTDSTNLIEYNCAVHVKQRVKIENLREDTVYIFCIVDQNDGRVVPFNCAAFRFTCGSLVVQDSHEDVWIWKRNKVMAIAIFSACLLLAIFTGALIMYCCLKRFPFFVANKKAQRKPSRACVNERDEIVEYHAPPNYITPTPARRSIKMGADCRPNLNNRRFSDTSAGSARSYVSAVTPSPFDIISFRMNNNNNSHKQNIRMSANKPEATYDEARDNILYMTKLPDVPPPLPPHPNRRSNQSNLSSNQSTNSASSSDPLFSISYRVQHAPQQCRTNSYA